MFGSARSFAHSLVRGASARPSWVLPAASSAQGAATRAACLSAGSKRSIRSVCSYAFSVSVAAAGAVSLTIDRSSPARCSAALSETIVLRIDGMVCQGCAATVRTSLEAIGNVTHVRVDLSSKLAYVNGHAPTEDLIAAVRAKGKQAQLVGRAGGQGFVEMTPSELKASLARSGKQGLVLDIDETLSATNVAWFQRLEELFGNPEGIPREELIRKYHLGQNVPFWKTPEALAWMQQQRDDPKAQDGLPEIPGAIEGVHALRKTVQIVGYATVRPESVNANTIAWLRERGFPDVPVVAKPAGVPFADGNQWKAMALHEMWPQVQGIVDDNPKVAMFAGKNYPGAIYLFGHVDCPSGLEFAVPCATWAEVVTAAKAFN